MPNRSSSSLPCFYEPAGMTDFRRSSITEGAEGLLQINTFTYMHFHSSMEIGMCRKGHGVCLLEGEETAFESGDIQIIFPFQNHMNRIIDAVSLWYFIDINPLQQLATWGAPDIERTEYLINNCMGLSGIINKKEYPLINELAWHIINAESYQHRMLCMNTLIEELAIASKELPKLQIRPEPQFMRLEPALKRVQSGLEQGTVPKVSELASICAMSIATFRRIFGEVMHQSPQEYMHAQRMHKAQRMLMLSNDTITQIALSVGFEDVSGFNRQFLRAYGMSPRQYRALRATRKVEEYGSTV